MITRVTLLQPVEAQGLGTAGATTRHFRAQDGVCIETDHRIVRVQRQGSSERLIIPITNVAAIYETDKRIEEIQRKEVPHGTIQQKRRGKR